jgi:hypothetical protein
MAQAKNIPLYRNLSNALDFQYPPRRDPGPWANWVKPEFRAFLIYHFHRL